MARAAVVRSFAWVRQMGCVMARFEHELRQLLVGAEQEGVLGPQQAERLLEMAAGRDRGERAISLASALAWIGGLTILLGAVLLVAANWQHIADWFKIVGLLALLALCHAGGFWARSGGRELYKLADALHFVGAGLFLAGIGLISQIYQVDSYPPDGVLWWLLATVPLAALLRSPSLSVMSVFALLLWAHMEGAWTGSPLRMPNAFTPHLTLEIGVGLALIGLAALLRRFDRDIAQVLRISGIAIVFGGMYLAGFFRHFTEVDADGSLWLPLVALLAGGVGLAVGYRQLTPDLPKLRAALAALIFAMLVWSCVALAADWGMLDRGPDLVFPGFGVDATYTALAWGLSAAAWVLWFLLALWCVAYGAQSGRLAYLNLGALGVGLGVITRFFDLVGGLAHTGVLFLVGGAVLLATGYFVERWRRGLIQSLQGASQ